MIGVGIFRVPAEVARHLDSPLLILSAWILGSFMTLWGVLCYAELSSRFPQTGGTYVFLREAFGPVVGFLFGWMEFLILRAGSVAAVSYILAAYLQNFIPFQSGVEKAVAVFAIALFTGLNILGLQIGTRVQNVLSSLKVLSLLLMSAVIFWVVRGPATSGSSIPFERQTFSGIGPAMIPILFTYGGWHESSYLCGEFKDTRKAFPYSIIASALIVTVLYVLMNAAYLKVMAPEQMMEHKAIAAAVFFQLFGSTGKSIVTAAVLISAAGALNSTILTGSRIPYALGRDHRKVEAFTGLHPVFKTPVLAFTANAAWASALVLWGNFEQLLYFCAFAKWLFFSLVGVSLFVIRSREIKTEKPSHFSLWGYPIVPALFTLSAVWICLTTVQNAPRETLFGGLILLAGIPVYFLLREPIPIVAGRRQHGAG